MKQLLATIFASSLLWSTLITPVQLPLHACYKHEPRWIPGLSYTVTSEEMGTFVGTYKKELAFLAIAITLGVSLTYCPWVQGLVGLDTEAEIDDWRVHIQKD